MKHLAKLVYRFFYFLDVKFNLIEEYDYETAPYCGHHYNGHRGKFTASSYHEGDGYCEVKFGILFKIVGSNYDGYQWEWNMPCLKVTSYFFILGCEDLAPRVEYGFKNYLKARRYAKKCKVDTKGKMVIKVRVGIA